MSVPYWLMEWGDNPLSRSLLPIIVYDWPAIKISTILKNKLKTQFELLNHNKYSFKAQEKSKLCIWVRKDIFKYRFARLCIFAILKKVILDIFCSWFLYNLCNYIQLKAFHAKFRSCAIFCAEKAENRVFAVRTLNLQSDSDLFSLSFLNYRKTYFVKFWLHLENYKCV